MYCTQRRDLRLVPFSKEKLGLAVLLSTVAIPALADTPVQGRAQSPGSLAKLVVVVGVFKQR